VLCRFILAGSHVPPLLEEYHYWQAPKRYVGEGDDVLSPATDHGKKDWSHSELASRAQSPCHSFEEPLAPFLIHTLYIEDLTHLTRVDQVSQHVSSS
jgi:hypothetical protein